MSTETGGGAGGEVGRAAGLDRRFEGIVLWSAEPVITERTARGMVALGEAGASVAWVAPAPVEQLAESLGRPAPLAGTVVLADSDGAGGHLLDSSGTHRVVEPHREVDGTVVDRAGHALVESLVGLGVTATALPRRGDAQRVAVALGRYPSAGTDGPGLEQLLYAHGISGLSHLTELAVDAAREAGLDDPRVLVDGSTVEISSEDAGDVVLGVLRELWRQGVDPQTVLVVADGLAGLPVRPPPVVAPDARLATFVLIHGGGISPHPDMTPLPGGTARLHGLLADQLRRRRRHALPEAAAQPGWSLELEGLDAETQRVAEALFSLADGHVGMSGTPLVGYPHRHPWTIAGGVYDGSGTDTRLASGPVVFELGRADGTALMRRILDLRTGILHERTGTGSDTVDSVRFLSLARPTTAVLRAECPRGLRSGPPLRPPEGAPPGRKGRAGATCWVEVPASVGGITAAAVQTRYARPPTQHDAGAGRAVIDRVAGYCCDPDTHPDRSRAVEALGRVSPVGFDRLLAEQRRAWAQRWEHADVVVEGDKELQLAVRFALFHLMASVADTGEAAVGARGLSGPGYSGHVFWDSDTFVLPFLAATHPPAARAIIEYRMRRLPAAIDAARASGNDGARFPWESARTGRDVTPRSAKDRSGRIVPIRTGQLEEHIVAEVPWAACNYVDWTGDEEFARGPLRRILLETARYWASRIRVDQEGIAHLYGVVGPDEYHEPVDDDAFTNVMARWNLRRAADAADTSGGADVRAAETRRWRDLADALVDGYDADTGIYEQFAGFNRLEPLIIAELAQRPIAADLLLGAERTNGAQVIKQADVLMLHHLVPDEVVAGSLEPNLRFYGPRTAHGSSLSPAIHASLFARAREFEPALEALRLAARMDLDDLSGSTAQGLHLATMGGLWQALAFGFLGLRPRSGRLHVDPVLPPSWTALEIRVRFRGSAVRVRIERARLTVRADRPVSVVVGGTPYITQPGPIEFRRRGARWETLP